MDNTLDPTAQPDLLPAIAASVVRFALSTVGGGLVTKGLITGSQEADIIGALLALLGVGWSMYQKYSAHKALKAAIAAPAK